MQAVKFNKDEQETVITFDAKKGTWTFYSCVPSHVDSFIKNPILNKEKIEVLTSYEGKSTSIKFTVENSLVTKSFLKKKRTLSKEHKQALQIGKSKKRVQKTLQNNL
ncbi:hypothetical protein SAMN05878482_103477 [Peribacillus simplex]|uniref:Uncharacterized protein n=1 Tax=Peribacillus simplex TaxID=1478 RepID=A0A9X8WKU0_9BACI|nr:hypothetical protein SAMN05878482_103477 [Peribacillus simplex]